MNKTRVLIVDDSITMRALFSGVLDEAPGICVVDHAANAAEARELIRSVRPDVVTLDVEMPGTSGLELLAEIMAEQPMPVIMLSTLTQKGSAATLQALELGAFDCFPKPKAATMEEFRKIGPRLAKLINAAAVGSVTTRKTNNAAPFLAEGAAPTDGVIALIGNTGAVDMVGEFVNRLPASCPPVIVHLGSTQTVATALVEKLDKSAKPNVRAVFDGQRLEPGNVYLIQDPHRHVVVDRWPHGMLRLVDGEPIGGHRPSANLLINALARTAAASVSVGFLSGMGDDGVAALPALLAAGGTAFAIDPAQAKAGELPGLAGAKIGPGAVDLTQLGTALLMRGLPPALAA